MKIRFSKENFDEVELTLHNLNEHEAAAVDLVVGLLDEAYDTTIVSGDCEAADACYDGLVNIFGRSWYREEHDADAEAGFGDDAGFEAEDAS